MSNKIATREAYGKALAELAKAYGMSEKEITDQLALIKYEYQPETNQFR